MTPIAPHISAFLQQRLPIERGASINVCGLLTTPLASRVQM